MTIPLLSHDVLHFFRSHPYTYYFVSASCLDRIRSQCIPTKSTHVGHMFCLGYILDSLSHHILVHPTISHDYISIIVSHRPIILLSIIIILFFFPNHIPSYLVGKLYRNPTCFNFPPKPRVVYSSMTSSIHCVHPFSLSSMIIDHPLSHCFPMIPLYIS